MGTVRNLTVRSKPKWWTGIMMTDIVTFAHTVF